MVTQELLKEHFEYRDGHLWWVKPTANCIKISQQFGCYDCELEASEAYDKATKHLHGEYQVKNV